MNPHRGSSFDDFLMEEGLYHEAQAHAIKKVLAWQLKQEMQIREFSKTRMAALMDTSRSAVDRILNPEDTSTTLLTMTKAAEAVGMQLDLRLVKHEDHNQHA